MEYLIVSDAYRCSHKPYDDLPHCAEMICDNYVNKCPRHSLWGEPDAECTLKVLGIKSTRGSEA